MPGPDRRTVLVGGLAFLAGCTTPTPTPGPTPTPSTAAPGPSPTPTPTPTATSTPTPPHEQLTMMSWNTLTGARGAGSFRRSVRQSNLTFTHRAPVLVRWITSADPDVLALQENERMGAPLRRPVRGLLPELPHYTGVHIDSDVPILFRTKRFTLKDSGISTISTAHFRRFCSWVILTSRRTGADVLVANTHLDSGESERMKRIRRASLVALAEVLQGVDPEGTLPLVLLGDFNTITHRRVGEGLPRAFEPLAAFGLVNSWTIAAADTSKVPGAATMNSLGTEVKGRWTYGALRHDGYTLDYVWTGPGVTVGNWEVVTGPGLREIDGFPFFAPGLVPSDHCPLRVEISIPI